LIWLTCATCDGDKPSHEFYGDVSRPRARKYSCKVCVARKARAKRLADPSKHRLAAKQYRERNLARSLVRGAKKRAIAKDIWFELDQHIDEIAKRIDAGCCELTGLSFQIGNGHHWASPSIDRIDNKGPYVYSNIRIILHGYNNAMGNWGEEVLFAMIDGRRSVK
jgi:hypothetical protein